MSQQARVGLLGGTFDPIHIGHLWLGETARDQLNLDEVWVLPVGQPPHKTEREITAVSHRLAMTQLALNDAPHFKLSRADMDRPHPHTTATLLTLLHQQHPHTSFWLLAGSDSLRDFYSWSEPQRVVQQCRLAILPRPGVVIDWERVETAVPHIRQAVDWLDGPTLDISSTAIRRWAASGHTLNYLLPTAVQQYIETHQLYQTKEA